MRKFKKINSLNLNKKKSWDEFGMEMDGQGDYDLKIEFKNIKVHHVLVQ